MNAVAELTAQNERLRRTRRVLDRQVGEARALATTGKRLAAEAVELRTNVELHDKAAALLAGIGEQRQADAQAKIEALVTQGMHSIFGPDLSFHLVPGVRAKTPVVDFVVRSTLDTDITVDTDVMEARGGGLAAVIGILLRVVRLLLSDNSDTPLAFDETAAHVSAEYETRLAEFLRELVDKTGIQIIMVTHSDAFSDAADVRYRFELHDGVTRVRAT